MPPPSLTAHLPDGQPAARQRPKSPARVLAEAEEQWLFTEHEIASTPSIKDGMSPEKERELRAKGIGFIRQVGIMLKLPELTLSTASIFFNRFLMRMSLESKPGQKALHHFTLGATALFLATKVEECCRKMKDIVIACCRVAQKNPNLIIDDQSKDYWRWRDTILLNEDVLLEVLCFDLTVEAPHKQLFDMLKYYRVEHNKQLRNAAWAFVTDSNTTQLCLLCSSTTIAAAALYAAARLCEVRLPDTDGEPWWKTQHVRLEDMLKAANYMAANYEHVPAQMSAGEGGQSIYVGLSHPILLDTEPGPDETPWDRTRLSYDQDIGTPLQPAIEHARSRRGSNGSGESKRARDNVDPGSRIGSNTDSATNGEIVTKRRKLSPAPATNGNSQEGQPSRVTTGPTSSGPGRENDEGSEEGELEE